MHTANQNTAVHSATDDAYFDPMEYDVMRESATRLSGEYIYWAREMRKLGNAEAAKVLMGCEAEVMRQADMVNAHDEKAIRAKTQEFTKSLEQITSMTASEEIPQTTEDTSSAILQKRLESIYHNIKDSLGSGLSRVRQPLQKTPLDKTAPRVARA